MPPSDQADDPEAAAIPADSDRIVEKTVGASALRMRELRRREDDGICLYTVKVPLRIVETLMDLGWAPGDSDRDIAEAIEASAIYVARGAIRKRK